MADVFQETIDLAELLIIGLVAYVVYEAYTSIQKAGSAKCDPNTLLGKFLCSGGENQPSSVPGNKTIAQSVGGYEGFGSDGQYYSCDANKMCTPMNCDANGNCTLTGSPVPAAQVGLASNNPTSQASTPTPTPALAPADQIPCLGSICIDPNTTDVNANTMPF